MDERLRCAHVEFVQQCRKHRIKNRGKIFTLQLGNTVCTCGVKLSSSELACACVCVYPRKQLVPTASSVPSLSQKHFNGADQALDLCSSFFSSAC